MDTYCTHKYAKVRAWLAKRPRFQMQFVPTSSSWMNLVERFFADPAVERVRPGSFPSVRGLVAAIGAYLAEWNANPNPDRWKADEQELLAKIQRARDSLERERAKQVCNC